MKKILSMFAILGLAASGSFAGDATPTDAKSTTITTGYNELADLTTVKTPEVKVSVGERTVSLQANYSYDGKIPKRPQNIEIRLLTNNSKVVWFEVDGSIFYKYDDKVARGPAELHLQQTIRLDGPTEYVETLTCQIPIDGFETIFSAEKVTFMLRGDPEINDSKLRENYPLGKAELAVFKELLKSIPQTK